MTWPRFEESTEQQSLDNVDRTQQSPDNDKVVLQKKIPLTKVEGIAPLGKFRHQKRKKGAGKGCGSIRNSMIFVEDQYLLKNLQKKNKKKLRKYFFEPRFFSALWLRSET